MKCRISSVNHRVGFRPAANAVSTIVVVLHGESHSVAPHRRPPTRRRCRCAPRCDAQHRCVSHRRPLWRIGSRGIPARSSYHSHIRDGDSPTTRRQRSTIPRRQRHGSGANIVVSQQRLAASIAAPVPCMAAVGGHHGQGATELICV